MTRPDPFDRSAPPYVEITQTGRWTWTANIHHGPFIVMPGSICFGRAHALNKARRMLARFCERQQRLNTRIIVDCNGGAE